MQRATSLSIYHFATQKAEQTRPNWSTQCAAVPLLPSASSDQVINSSLPDTRASFHEVDGLGTTQSQSESLQIKIL